MSAFLLSSPGGTHSVMAHFLAIVALTFTSYTSNPSLRRNTSTLSRPCSSTSLETIDLFSKLHQAHIENKPEASLKLAWIAPASATHPSILRTYPESQDKPLLPHRNPSCHEHYEELLFSLLFH